MQESKIILHYSSDPVLQYRFKKIKSIVSAAKLDNIAEEPKQLFTNLHEISPIPVLPLLEDTESKLTIAGSSAIIRYLASISQDQTLYGAGDNFKQSLIDQWLDYCTCELQSITLAVELFISGRQVDIQTVYQDAEKALSGLNKGLNKKKYLVGDSLTIADLALAAVVSPLIVNLFNELERKKFTHILNWFLGIAGQSKEIEPKQLAPKANAKIQKWKNKGKKDEKGGQKGGQKGGKKQEKGEKGKKEDKGKKEEKGKKEKKEKKDKKGEQPKKIQTNQQKDEQDELFGEDDEQTPAPAPVSAIKPKIEPKKKPAAKSIVIFDVKVYEEEQDLMALFEKIKNQIVIDGLVWNEQPKIQTVAYTMKKLQIGCVVEDEKVSVQEDIFEKLREWENEIQSVDTVSFQKL